MSAKRVTEVRSRSVALSGKADGSDALEPLARFTSNPAGAVVAGEVRSLAQRSKAAAARTEQLIRQSVEEVASGERVTVRASGELGQIVAAVTQASEVMGEATRGAREQGEAVARIGAAMDRLEAAAGGSASGAEASAAAAEELSGQAAELAALVATFRLPEETRVRSADAAA